MQTLPLIWTKACCRGASTTTATPYQGGTGGGGWVRVIEI
jgi:hypothetical protein